ncbi:histidine kinase [Sorangium cellulosum]|uniref:histidine kinase n=1 Tax=Sorangium cellulosum TaxID=56 RepID=A0A2L0ESR9_SORCE|nr:hybrid sensor histidine kinase/response regulator [Sorangium cellulosum]AUX42339.1 histidine kinase [Sorangium cellulosum]
MIRAARERRALLIVDDEWETLKALRRELRRDYDVLVAESAAQGYEILRERPVDVVLSDQRMPEMTGTEFYARVKADFPDTVRLLMTAYADTSAAVQAINEGGVYRFLCKPWDPERLAAVVRDAFCHHDRLSEVQRRLSCLEAKAGELERANQKLAALNQNIHEFVGTTAHDLRNPIAAIRWFAAMLLSGAGDPGKDPRRHLLKIQANADFTLQLLEDLLDITMLEHGDVALRMQDAALSDIVAAAVSLNEHSARQKGIAVVVDVPSGLPPVRCDVERIEQVLSNLLSNAFKFSHAGTTVTVSARAGDGVVEVAVADQGLGIRPEEIGNLFGKFGRTSTRSTGGEKSTGLGLSICKQLVERHGGSIRVESALGRGTRVLFTLAQAAAG